MFKKIKINKILKAYSNLDDQEKVEARKQLSTYGERPLSRIVESVSRKEILVDQGTQLLGGLYKKDFLNEYIQLLATPLPELREIIKGVVLKNAGKSAIPVLLDNFDNPDIHVRNSVCSLLAELAENSHVSGLASFITHANKEIAGNAISIIGEIGGDEALECLTPLLAKDSLRIKRKTVQAICQGKNKQAIPHMTQLLRKDKDPALIKMILSSVAEMGDKRTDRRVVSAVQLHVSNDDITVRQAAVTALGKIATAEIIPDMISLLKDADVNTRRSVVDVLYQIEGSEVGNVLTHCMKDSDWWVREIAMEALIQVFGNDETVNQNLLKLLKDRDENTRRIVTEYFNHVVYPPACTFLLELLDDKDWWVKEKAVTALGKQNNAAIIPSLMNRMADHEIKSVIPTALGMIKSEKALRALLPLLKNKDKSIRYSSLKAVQNFDHPKIVSLIKPCAVDEDPEISKMALQMLAERTKRKISRADIQIEFQDDAAAANEPQENLPKAEREISVPPKKIKPEKKSEIDFSGNLDFFSLQDVIQSLESTRKTGCLQLVHGKLFFKKGFLLHGEFKEDDHPLLKGKEAVYALFQNNTGPFKFVIDEASSTKTIFEPTLSIVLDAVRRIDEQGEQR